MKNEEKLLENELCQKIEVAGGYNSSAEEFRGVIRRLLDSSTVKSQRGYSIIKVLLYGFDGANTRLLNSMHYDGLKSQRG